VILDRALIRLLQALNYGSILDLKIVNGELSFDPEPEVLIDVRLDKGREGSARIGSLPALQCIDMH
jgi:hypothetical protein